MFLIFLITSLETSYLLNPLAQKRFNEKFNEAAGEGREFNLIAESKALGTARKNLEEKLGFNMFDPNMGVKKLD